MQGFRKRKYWRSITPLLWLEYFAHRTLPHLLESHMAYIPFSAANGSRLVRRKLSKALSVWATAYLANQSGEVSVLYRFCQMYLSLPTLQTVTEQNPRLHPIKQK